jgi:hypothetical protein
VQKIPRDQHPALQSTATHTATARVTREPRRGRCGVETLCSRRRKFGSFTPGRSGARGKEEHNAYHSVSVCEERRERRSRLVPVPGSVGTYGAECQCCCLHRCVGTARVLLRASDQGPVPREGLRGLALQGASPRHAPLFCSPTRQVQRRAGRSRPAVAHFAGGSAW